MCWLVKSKFPEIKTAEENINAFKVVIEDKESSEIVVSYHRGYYYKIGETYKIADELKIFPNIVGNQISKGRIVNPCTYYSIFEGFHSYSMDCKVRIIIDEYPKLQSLYIKHHGMDMAGYLMGMIVLCEIPKGSTYYENDRGELVSDSIILTKIIPNKDVLERQNKSLSDEVDCRF